MAIRYHVLACDYDGTLARHGQVDPLTIEALERCRLSGRKLLLVTGRELEELFAIFPRADLFKLIVAENGAVVFDPATRNTTLLAERPPETLIRMLQDRGVAPMSVGQVIIATWRPHETTVLESIRDAGLEMQVIFNKDAVMVLPSGINKASGLQAALASLGLSRHNCVAIGDAENDHTFLTACEFACAVENALPALKERADLVTKADHGDGVIELIDALIDNDLSPYASVLTRHFLPLGMSEDRPITVDPYETSVLLAGSSGSGKSTLTTAFIEQLVEHEYQFCIIDPEGDYQNLEHAVVLGDMTRAPSPEEVLDLLSDPDKNAVVNLLGLALDHRPQFFEQIYPRLLEMQAATGHPHWIILDESHHLLPGSWQRDNSLLQRVHGVLFITVHPEHLPDGLLGGINTLLVTGKDPQSPITEFALRVGVPAPIVDGNLPTGDWLMWSWKDDQPPLRFQATRPRSERYRHHRKYAEGKLDEDRSFYFRGPKNELKLRAYNLALFVQMADGVDEDTWNYHLMRGDYSRWFSDKIGDADLADEAAEIQRDGMDNTRTRIREAIERRYTLPE